MGTGKPSKLKEEPHLSGAYIRSLVKQLTSSRTKDPMNPKGHGSADSDGFSGKNMADYSEDTTLYYSSDNPPSVYSSSSPSSSSFPSPFTATEEIPSVSNTCEGMPPAAFDVTDSYGGAGLHQVMDDEEMAEIRSIGEQHQMEWNDTMNLVTSAWWFKFMKTMELDPEVKTEDDGCHPFEQVMEFPAWLNANDQQHFNDHFSQDYFQDAALPCMDIEEIEGIDGEWLA
ncbi:hypothetical protein POTOM_026120 [Populus tomentosa]|uniref:Uncharacterized protein n=1 Tax=Populus tomentosa TaxID=118781 RepID=A0A8X7ZFB0_POPTO|nr:hypothetical protein POTOM_026120 [Populus tomentosa]